MQIDSIDEQGRTMSADPLHPTLLASVAMAVSASGFVLFFFDALAEPTHAGLVMLLAWLLMTAAIATAAEAVDREHHGSGRHDFAVGALRTTVALPLVIAYVVLQWLLVVMVQGIG